VKTKKKFRSEIKLQDACSHHKKQLKKWNVGSARSNSSRDDGAGEDRILTSLFSRRVCCQVAGIFYSGRLQQQE
jgi:hypothetical protein